MLLGDELFEYAGGKVSLESSLAVKQDQLILIPTILPQIASLTTSTAVWTTLEKIYASGSEGRILWLKRQLKSIKKESITIDEYLGQIMVLRDALAASRSTISDRETALITLDR